MMNKICRIFHHACWFALLGPLIGVTVIITVGTLSSSDPIHHNLLITIKNTTIIMVASWFFGGPAALLTGITTALLPSPVYYCTWLRTLICGAFGALIASLCWLILSRELFGKEMAEVVIYFSTAPGLLAGVVMGWLVPYLPFSGKKKRTDQETGNNHTDMV